MLRDKLVVVMPTTNSDANNGINNSYALELGDDSLSILVKEELQNSTDAHDSSTSNPTHVTFSHYSIDASEIPDRDRLIELMEDAKAYWAARQQNNKAPEAFFEKALASLRNKEIPVLKISDSNTVGLEGINEEYSSWENLVKNDGVSDKPLHAGGCYGNGKNAAIACSSLRMVIYRTQNKEKKYGIQGVLKLPNYKKGEDNFTGSGFLSAKADAGETQKNNALCENLPVFTADRIRMVTGTDKYIIGFKEENDLEKLKEKLIVAAINSFYYAIYTGQLYVSICGCVDLNKETLVDYAREYVKKYESGKVTRSGPYVDDATMEQIETLLADDEPRHITLFDKNDVDVYIRSGNNLSKRAGIIGLNGMKIFDKKNFHTSTAFSAVVVFKTPEVGAFFKQFEDVKHSSFKSSKNKDKEKQFNKMTSEIHKAITNMVREFDPPAITTAIPFAGMSGIFRTPQLHFDENDDIPLKVSIVPGKVKKTKMTASDTTARHDVPSNHETTGSGKKHNSHSSVPTEPADSRSTVSELDYSIKTSYLKKDDSIIYTMTIEAFCELDDAVIRLKTATEKSVVDSNKDDLKISSAEDEFGKHLTVRRKTILIGELEQNIPKAIQITVPGKRLRSLEVTLDAIQRQ